MAVNILIFDVEKSIEESLKKLLKKDGFELVFAPVGSDAPGLARENQPALIMLNASEAGSGAVETCRLLRGESDLKEIPILAGVEPSNKKSKLNILAAGADDIITAPYDGVELRARIHFVARLNRPQPAAKSDDALLALDATLASWATALEQRDEPHGHTRRVTEVTLRMAQKFDVPAEEVEHIRRGALLHDIGKMGVPDTILLKQGALVNEEWEIMRRHPDYAQQWLSPIKFFEKALEIPYCHHEKWDGSGYPRKLKGEEIPFSARLFALVDVWDALRSDRPYRAAWSVEKVKDYIRSQSGRQFDPALVDIFLEEIEKA